MKKIKIYEALKEKFKKEKIMFTIDENQYEKVIYTDNSHIVYDYEFDTLRGENKFDMSLEVDNDFLTIRMYDDSVIVHREINEQDIDRVLNPVRNFI